MFPSRRIPGLQKKRSPGLDQVPPGSSINSSEISPDVDSPGAATAKPDNDSNSQQIKPKSPEDLASSWRSSVARQRAQTRFLPPYLAGAILLYGGGALVWFSSNLSRQLGVPRTLLIVAGATLVLVGIILLMYAVVQRRDARIEFYEAQEGRARGELAEAIDSISDSNDLIGLMRANRKQMDAYDAIARRQAAVSYRSSQAAMALGLVLLGVGIVIAIFSADPTTKYTAAFLTAVGTAVGGYISRTFIRVQQDAMFQLNYYFQQPLIQSYLLTAERMVQQMEPTDRAQAWNKIVTSIVEQLLNPSSYNADTRKNSSEANRGS